MNLLQKTIRNYFVYSIVVLLVAVPVFYFVIQSIVREDTDEDLMATKEMLKPKISDALLNNTIGQLKFLDQDISISVSTYTKEFDSLTTIEEYDSVSKELVPHRILTSHFIANGKPCLLQVKTSLVDNEDLIQSIVKVQGILLLLLLTGLIIINRSLSKRIWKPFYTTLDKLRNYKVEQHAALALAKSSVNDLNTSLEELTGRTHKTFISQKEFTENASHEMQTPLAVFQSKLELLMQTTSLNEEQAQLMGDLGDASQRMVRLNKSLILLTKIENNQFAEKENVSLNNILENFVQQYQPQAQEKQISIHSKLQEEVMLKANKMLIEILVSNLLGNAIRHNYINGTILILSEHNKLTIQNTGKPSALDEQKLFKRFQKDSSDNNSIGLGLEIYRVALMILLIAVLGISGSYLGLYFTNTPLNVGSYTGLIMIVGIIGENAIFTFLQFRESLRQYNNVDQAIIYSISTRLRPKLMTALGAIIALMPIALGIGTGAQLHQPLAIAVIGGFIVAFPLFLIVLPGLMHVGFKNRKVAVE